MQWAMVHKLLLVLPCPLHEEALKMPLAAYPSPQPEDSPRMKLDSPITLLGNPLICLAKLEDDGCDVGKGLLSERASLA